MRVRAALLFLLCCGPGLADEPLRVAVASNFAPMFNVLADDFTAQTGIEIAENFGSTGSLFTMISNGAPLEVFLAADVDGPRRLEDAGVATAQSRFTYAVGQLVVWSKTAHDCEAALKDPDAGYVALPNPDTAPYGRAAREFLESTGTWEAVASRTANAGSVSQAYYYAASGNAVVAFIANSYVWLIPGMRDTGCVYEVPPTTHGPIEQQAVLLDGDSTAARRFLDYLRSDRAKSLIRTAGYEVPE